MAAERADAPAPARRCAYRVLRRVFEDGAFTGPALQHAASGLDARDRALAMRLAYGAVQRRGTLDALIERLARRPARRIDAPLLAALRLGLYELVYSQGAPAHAVVNDAVELAGEQSRAGRGLVNAVLRRAAREGAEALLAPFDDRTAEHAALLYSHPRWVSELWWEELGADAARALMAADNEPGELALRANTLVTDAAELAAALPVASHRDERLHEALVLDGPLDSSRDTLFAHGAYLAQSRAAMFVSRALAPEAGQRVLDLCAAPGGKSTHLAALAGDGGEVLAVERNPARARELRATAERMRAASVRVLVADAAEPLADAGDFERVLVDPPCSGLGTLQARPDLRWRVQPGDIAALAALQRRILENGASHLCPGGMLVYSTCTIGTEENEPVIKSFLAAHPDFDLDDLTALWPEAASPGLAGTLQTRPDRDRTAGFFIARLRRR
ncbi:MAG TPA: 16S rRNA (cytosine(967)-C(5))-methyltransferase RsmB [Solirubrobacteraceae bacterium]|nr:16S rRNA (cytosine(967)-C(5))-methyltransferase RsmB [Solirubrobacteraceae bacterium]